MYSEGTAITRNNTVIMGCRAQHFQFQIRDRLWLVCLPLTFLYGSCESQETLTSINKSNVGDVLYLPLRRRTEACHDCAPVVLLRVLTTPLFLHLAASAAESRVYVYVKLSVVQMAPWCGRCFCRSLRQVCFMMRAPGSWIQADFAHLLLIDSSPRQYFCLSSSPPLCRRRNILACICKYIVHGAFYSYVFWKVLDDLSSCPALSSAYSGAVFLQRRDRASCTPRWYSWTY